MQKACVIGGSNGIGLAISKCLVDEGYKVIICDKVHPSLNELPDSSYEYIETDLLDFNPQTFIEIANDPDLQVLMITAGLGRVTAFENLHFAEIDNLLTINTVSILKIINIFFVRIKNEKIFYTGVMGSIAGFVNSPLFSVYAASKAAICRFTESVNVELEKSAVKNRILNVSPGVIKGTRFNGGENDLTQMQPLAKNIVMHLMNQDMLYIPNYEEIYKNVIERNTIDAHAFGLSSYEYKINNGRVCNDKRVVVGYLSGTFDLFHVGHLNLLRRAKAQCDYLVVGVHPDASHKGKEVFIPFNERKSIVSSIKYVDQVIDSMPEDVDVWNKIHYNKLFVGSDYKGTERFNRYEKELGEKGVEIIYFPYTTSTSSTQIRNVILSKSK